VDVQEAVPDMVVAVVGAAVKIEKDNRKENQNG